VTVLDVSVDQLDTISAQAREVHVGRLVLAFIAAVLIGFGRCVGAVVNAAVWSFLAMREGYRDARAPHREAGVG
jgi:hypothetical protein